ncbi:hypothetical protein ACP4OV_010562 [Aristida adscensionis]
MESKQMSVGMSRKPGDWVCRSCQYVNFCKREACQRCSEAKLGVERTDYGALGGDWDVKPGDWYCFMCGAHNYASRATCFKCTAAKNDAAAVAQGWAYTVAAPAGMRSGDWICPSAGLQRAELRQPNGVLPVQYAQIIILLRLIYQDSGRHTQKNPKDRREQWKRLVG